MFFQVSKILWFFVQPVNFAIFVSVVGVLLLYSRFIKIGRILVTVAVLFLSAISFLPVGFYWLAEAENDIQRSSTPEHVDGIIVLGGSIDWHITNGQNEIQLGNGADRITEALILSRKFPKAKIVFSGYHPNCCDNAQSTDLYQKYLIELGFAESNIVMEIDSRNTAENVELSKILLGPKENEEWLLVTSAFHMPRALNEFTKNNWIVTPWPVDYRTPGKILNTPPFHSTLDFLTTFSLALKEWIGSIAYSIR